VGQGKGESCGFEGFLRVWFAGGVSSLLLREALSSWEAGVPVALGLALLQRWWLIYIAKISVIVLPPVWIHACPGASCFFHFIHPALLFFRTDAVCGLKCLSGLWRGKRFLPLLDRYLFYALLYL